jgi:ERCC4-related helicase
VQGVEAHEASEDEALDAFVATSLAELITERDEVRALLGLAEAVHARGRDAELERLRELLADPAYRDQKVILYTEHKDTLDFLTRALEGMGYAGQVATVHGGMSFVGVAVEASGPHQAGDGARFFVGTDAAAEGINLQFC